MVSIKGMDPSAYIERRKGTYMGRSLRSFENLIEPHLDMSNPAVEKSVKAFKADVRGFFSALGGDVQDFVGLDAKGLAMNGAAEDLRDSIGASRR